MKRIAGIATIRGREQALREAVESLSPQVDEVAVYHNGLQTKDEALALQATFPDNVGVSAAGAYEEGDITDAGKFFWCPLMQDSDFFLSCDDDLIYPADYVDHLARWLAIFPDPAQTLLTLHGKILPPHPVESFYRDTRILNLHNQRPYYGPPIRVDVPGTGCSAMLGALARRLDLEAFEALPCAADLHVARFLRREGARAFVVPHPAGYTALSPHLDHFRDTIWAWAHQDDADHTAFVNEHLITKEVAA